MELFCTREALKIMNNQIQASIINMGSVLGTTGGPSSPHYSAANQLFLDLQEQQLEN